MAVWHAWHVSWRWLSLCVHGIPAGTLCVLYLYELGSIQGMRSSPGDPCTQRFLFSGAGLAWHGTPGGVS